MSADSIVRARINEDVKEEAALVLAAMGLTLSDAVRMLLFRVAREKALPFEPLIPNDETIKAMKAARSGKLVHVGNINNLLSDLNEND
ncbi:MULTISPECIES: type II toxin-antitoxin system RelB/DinJ family antitoxin [Rickettsia]|nr:MULTISPECIES: type II toxin-antitoxin system RelB/DinJ family antitoxin [spotted fever group]ABV76914.1 DNA-damage-inducible protein J [Rickettsia rickettsii str. 'Sheila Smith']ABY73291.1 DNA-damage-inducible protein J [Rickettsia rickettsii str. Iowa]ACP53998.1 DNA-damage-inducible protein J [Rickettsia africae ESF-5]ACR47920.1 DNA-damage-inducible protein J [Rickettsia peacockii str. Rustic]AEV92788.1 DNA-damage-inducible protein J [Rickettsia slovaca 13-B]